ncbi:MAG: reverse transcriptase domain-containing protein [Actinomycetes bacterium]
MVAIKADDRPDQLQRIYRQLFNPDLYLLAYGRIYSNQGAMTPGCDGETADGMSLEVIASVIDAMRHERYRFQPVKRVYIPKPHGGRRPLGLPTWTDKLVGEVVRLLLEAYYEPTFSDHSHGFRPRRGCHTALREVADQWTGTTWFIEGDIADCFGRLDHQVLISILSEHIHDNRFLQLIRRMLTAGYLEDWTWGATLSGAPQGGVASPILSNIYLNRLDKYIEKILVPEYTRGRRAPNPAYRSITGKIYRARKTGDRNALRPLQHLQRKLPSQDPQDPDYRRLRYIRYADDHLLGFTGPRVEAEQIKTQLATFLSDELKLDLSPEKTLITHARTGAAKFLGYEITVGHDNRRATNGRRSINGTIMLRVPRAVIKNKCAPYLKGGKPAHCSEFRSLPDHTIIGTFGSRYRGIIQYYLLASNVWKLDKLEWVMTTSLLKTLAAKHRSSVTKMARKHQATVMTPHGPRRCYEAVLERAGRKPLVARHGGIPLKRNWKAVIDDCDPTGRKPRRKELLHRLLARRCELCEKPATVEVHQIRKLAELAPKPDQPQPTWKTVMARKRRKTLIVCPPCHDHIHARTATLTKSLESRMQ